MRLPTTAELKLLLVANGPSDATLRGLLRKWETCYLELVALPKFTPDCIRRCYAAEERAAKRALVLAGYCRAQ